MQIPQYSVAVVFAISYWIFGSSLGNLAMKPIIPLSGLFKTALGVFRMLCVLNGASGSAGPKVQYVCKRSLTCVAGSEGTSREYVLTYNSYETTGIVSTSGYEAHSFVTGSSFDTTRIVSTTQRSLRGIL